MSDDRKRFYSSDYETRKEKEAKVYKIVWKTRKLDSFFMPVSANNNNNNNNFGLEEQEVIETEIQSTSYDVLTASPNNLSAQVVVTNDPAEWILNDAMRKYIAVNGFSHNLEGDLSKSERAYPDKVRYVSKKTH